MVELGRLFLNDNVWSTYDVFVDMHMSMDGGYLNPDGSLE